MILMVMAALVAIGQTEDCIYKDGFESDLQPPWRVVDGVPAVAPCHPQAARRAQRQGSPGNLI